MCGIFGYKFNGSPDRRRIAVLTAALSIYNDSRGGHSWGSFWPKQWRMRKGVGKITINMPASQLSQSNFVLCHTRYATVGAQTRDNAHPFEFRGCKGTVVGAHNGAINNHWSMKHKHNRSDLEVDSMHLFAHLADGMDMSELEGYGACWWIWRHLPDSVFLCRFHNGSLAAANVRIQGVSGVVFSSDKDALEYSLMAAEVDYTMYSQPEDGVIYEIKDNELWNLNKQLGIGKGWKQTVHTTTTTGCGTGYYSESWRESRREKKRRHQDKETIYRQIQVNGKSEWLELVVDDGKSKYCPNCGCDRFICEKPPHNCDRAKWVAYCKENHLATGTCTGNQSPPCSSNQSLPCLSNQSSQEPIGLLPHSNAAAGEEEEKKQTGAHSTNGGASPTRNSEVRSDSRKSSSIVDDCIYCGGSFFGDEFYPGSDIPFFCDTCKMCLGCAEKLEKSCCWAVYRDEIKQLDLAALDDEELEEEDTVTEMTLADMPTKAEEGKAPGYDDNLYNQYGGYYP